MINGVTLEGNKTAEELNLYTKTSQLVNDSGYLTQHQDLSGYVQKEAGKGLSSNDFTNEMKDKLEGLRNWVVIELDHIPTPLDVEYTDTLTGKVMQYPIGAEVRVGTEEGLVFYKLYNKDSSGADWRVATGGEVDLRESVNITLNSNQANSDNSLNGAIVTVTDTTLGQVVMTQAWSGQPLQAKITPLSEYTVDVSAVEGYATPGTKTFTSAIQGMRNVVMTYNTCILTVLAEGLQEGLNPNITVDFATSSKVVKSGDTVKVPYDSAVTVSCDSVEGYAKPDSVTFVPAELSKTVTMTYIPSTLSVIIDSNQEDKTDIGGLKVEISYGSFLVQAGSGEVISIPINEDITVSFPDLEGYKKPGNIVFSSTGGVIEKTGTYETEIVSVQVLSDNGSSVIGQEITINGTTHTYQGDVISQKVPFGVEYQVSANTKPGYSTPAIQTFTASEISRTVTATYREVKLGVFILDTDGGLFTRSQWNTSNNSKAVGVAVLSNNCKFVIALEEASSTMQWGGYGTTISDIVTATAADAAKKDYAGETNTDKIIAQLGTGNAPAAEYCKNYSFKNGKKGYLGSCGEWNEAYLNKAEIDTDLSLIGGTALNTSDYYWTSTQYSSYNSWILNWSYGDTYGTNKDRNRRVRAFSAF